MSFQYLFGPVPSRRLGISLGVDIVPHKTCTLDCIYCECGKTTDLTIDRKIYFNVNEIKRELDFFLYEKPKLDFITFSGSGEPTLNSKISEITRFIKSKFPEYKIALLTNGTLFYDSNVKSEICDVDLLKISIDAATEKTFQLINRPHPELNLSQIIEGIFELKKDFSSKIWIEVFLVSGLNDTDSELSELKKVISLIEPDKIQLNTIDRPGTESFVKQVDEKKLKDISSYLFNAEIISRFNSKIKTGVFKDITGEAILATLKRRPCTVKDISEILSLDEENIKNYLELLLNSNKILKTTMQRGVFYLAKEK
ncbi:MAG: radical SAM protein [Desulfobacterales bacterium]|nr:radical SAM protein [Desulfobacterales bacterium]